MSGPDLAVSLFLVGLMICALGIYAVVSFGERQKKPHQKHA